MKLQQLSILLICMLTLNMYGQDMQTFAEGTEVKVDGSSTVSDWSVPVKKVEGKMQFAEGFSGKKGDKIQDILIVMDVKSMEGRGPDMNEKILNAFKAEEHPQIIFEASEAVCSESAENGFKLTSKGTLKMAGQSKEVELLLDGKSTDSGFAFIGSQKIDMTTFGMEPPTAFFGSLEVEKEVSVIFNILVDK